MLYQVVLKSDESTRTCWVDRQVKVGDELTLKNSEDPKRWWTVTRLGGIMATEQIHKDWKVGGIR